LTAIKQTFRRPVAQEVYEISTGVQESLKPPNSSLQETAIALFGIGVHAYQIKLNFSVSLIETAIVNRHAK